MFLATTATQVWIILGGKNDMNLFNVLKDADFNSIFIKVLIKNIEVVCSKR